MSREQAKRLTGPSPSRLRRLLWAPAAFALAALCLLAPASKAEPPLEPDTVASSRSIDGVVELFTSQGCASCPQADATLTELAANERLLTLSYHVDYWDYIDWKDPLGSQRNSERQKAYAKAIGHRSVFTPQMIVNGEHDIEPLERPSVDAALALDAFPERSRAAELRLSRIGSTLHIEADAPPEAEGHGQIVLILVTYRESTVTSVERGDNAGRDLVNSHSVRDWQVVGKMNGKSIELDLPVAALAGAEGGETGSAVLLQAMDEDGLPGPILAAAVLPL